MPTKRLLAYIQVAAGLQDLVNVIIVTLDLSNRYIKLIYIKLAAARSTPPFSDLHFHSVSLTAHWRNIFFKTSFMSNSNASRVRMVM